MPNIIRELSGALARRRHRKAIMSSISNLRDEALAVSRGETSDLYGFQQRRQALVEAIQGAREDFGDDGLRAFWQDEIAGGFDLGDRPIPALSSILGHRAITPAVGEGLGTAAWAAKPKGIGPIRSRTGRPAWIGSAVDLPADWEATPLPAARPGVRHAI